MIRVVQCVLRDVRVGPLQAGPDPLRRLIRELDGHLEQADRELGVDLRRHPNPKVRQKR